MSMADLSQYNEMEVAAIMSTAKKVATLPLLIDFGIQQTVKDSNAGKDTTDPLLVLLAAEVRRVVQHEICGAEPSPARAHRSLSCRRLSAIGSRHGTRDRPSAQRRSRQMTHSRPPLDILCFFARARRGGGLARAA